MGGKTPGGDGLSGAGDLHPSAEVAGAESRMDRAGSHACPGEEGDGADLQVAQEDRPIPAAPSDPRYELNSCAAA